MRQIFDDGLVAGGLGLSLLITLLFVSFGLILVRRLNVFFFVVDQTLSLGSENLRKQKSVSAILNKELS